MAATSPEHRSIAASIAANARWSKSDPVDGTAAARAKFLERFEDEVDPDRTLPAEERARRAARARKAHMQRLALKSAKARAKGGAPDAA